MRHKIFIIVTLICFSLVIFSQNIHAQNITKDTPKIDERAEKEKHEVQIFVDSFTKAFDETKDINLISRKFFAKEFKSQLVNFYKKMFLDEMKTVGNNIFTKISNDEIYQFILLGTNFYYLSIMTNDGICCEGNLKNMYPPDVLTIMQKSNLLSSILNDSDNSDNKFQTINLDDLSNLKIDLKKIHNAQLKYLENRPTNWKNTCRKNIVETRNHFKDFRSFLCSDDDCQGLAKGTRIIEIGAFPFILLIIKEKSFYKILNILPYIQ